MKNIEKVGEECHVVRRKNRGSLVPPEYAYRSDFILVNEFRMLCVQVGPILGFDLIPFHSYFEAQVLKSKYQVLTVIKTDRYRFLMFIFLFGQ